MRCSIICQEKAVATLLSVNGRSRKHVCASYGSWALVICYSPVTTPLHLLRLAQPTENAFNTKERSLTATVSCGQRPQHLRGHREDIAVVEPHSSLWPKATTFESSLREVFLVVAPTVHCGQRPQKLQDQRFYYNFGILYNSGHLSIIPYLLAMFWASMKPRNAA